MFMLFCCKISFVTIYTLLSQNRFYCDLRTFVWRKNYQKITNIRCGLSFILPNGSTHWWSCHYADGGEDANDGGDNFEGADDEGARLQGGVATHLGQKYLKLYDIWHVDPKKYFDSIASKWSGQLSSPRSTTLKICWRKPVAGSLEPFWNFLALEPFWTF